VPDFGPAPAGEPRLATTAHGSAPVRAETLEAGAGRPDLLSVAPARVRRLAIGPADCPARNGSHWASERVSSLWELENPVREAEATGRTAKSAGADSGHEPEQPAPGCATRPRRAAPTGY
jgi:hypothetical protein